MMKKLKKICLLILVFAMVFSIPTMATETTLTAFGDLFSISVNGTFTDLLNYTYNNPDYLGNKAVLVPLRAVCEGFGYEVIWNEDRSIDLKTEKGEPKFNPVPVPTPVADSAPLSLAVYADELTIRLNGETVSTPHFLYEGTTLVPVSFFQTVMNCHVYADYSIGFVKIYDPDYISFGENEVFYFDGVMLTENQYQDVWKFLSNAMGGAEANVQTAEQELSYLKASRMIGEKIVDEKAFEQFCTLNNIDKLMEDLQISDKDFFLEHILKPIYYQYSVTDATALPYYTPTAEQLAAQHAKSTYSQGHWMKAKHILISNKEKAEEVLKQLKKNPKDFDKLMEAHSEDPGSKAYPQGYLFTEGQMVTEFYEGALALKAGEISNLVESTYGYHIILKVADYENGAPIEDVKEDLHLAFAQEQFTNELNTALANVITFPNYKALQQ